MSDSRVAALLREAGVSTRLSIRAAAKRCGVSRETISKIMRGDTQLAQPGTLAKLANGLGINPADLERARLIDAGYLQAASAPTVTEALALIQGLSSHDLATIQIEIGKMQQARAAARTAE